MALSRRTFVAISGGVDSSVALLLQRQRQPEAAVAPVFMSNWNLEEDDQAHASCSERDEADARAVVRQVLGDESLLRRVNFQSEYWERVFEHYVKDLARGLTPNPDVWCNQRIKFHRLLEWCWQQQQLEEQHHPHPLSSPSLSSSPSPSSSSPPHHAASSSSSSSLVSPPILLTGHYARRRQCILPDGSVSWQLLRAIDPSKDQSYFLASISQRALAAVDFPLGDLPKSQVRSIAAKHGLVTAEKRDSMGICFIGKRNFKEFICQYIVGEPGDVVLQCEEGKRTVIHQHEGLFLHTIGERYRLGGLARPVFVTAKDMENNLLVVEEVQLDGRKPASLMAPALETSSFSWIHGSPPAALQRNGRIDGLHCKTRNTAPALPCSITWLEDSSSTSPPHPPSHPPHLHPPFHDAIKEEVGVKDDGWLPSWTTQSGPGIRVIYSDGTKECAVTPGQVAVLYDGDVCLGGGDIANAIHDV